MGLFASNQVLAAYNVNSVRNTISGNGTGLRIVDFAMAALGLNSFLQGTGTDIQTLDSSVLITRQNNFATHSALHASPAPWTPLQSIREVPYG